MFPDSHALSNDIAVNPGHWTVDMRTDALEPARLNSPSLKVQHETLTAHITHLYAPHPCASAQ